MDPAQRCRDCLRVVAVRAQGAHLTVSRCKLSLTWIEQSMAVPAILHADLAQQPSSSSFHRAENNSDYEYVMCKENCRRSRFEYCSSDQTHSHQLLQQNVDLVKQSNSPLPSDWCILLSRQRYARE